MKIRLISDLHMEFYYNMRTNSEFFVPEMDEDKDSVLVLAGDIGTTTKYDMSIIEEFSERFKAVVITAGNHEYYKSDINVAWNIIKDEWAYHQRLMDVDIDNVHFLNRESVIIEDTRFICATMWTNFDNENYDSMNYARHAMNDFRIIKNGDYRFQPEDALKIYDGDLAFIEKELKESKEKNVVVTHHPPSGLMTHPRFKGSLLNPSFTNNLDEFIEEYKPIYWLCGHIHDATECKIGDTTVIANPSGYPNEQRAVAHDPHLILEL